MPASKRRRSCKRNTHSPFAASSVNILGTWSFASTVFRAWCAGMEATLSTPPQAFASLAVRLLTAANAISCRRWLKLDFSAGLRLAPSSRDAGEYLRAAKLSRVSRVGWLCVLYKRSLILHTDYHHRCNHHQHKHAVIAVSISIIIIIGIIII